LPSEVIGGLAKFAANVYVKGIPPMAAMQRAFVGDVDALSQSPVTLIFRNPAGRPQATSLVLSKPPHRLWGLASVLCPTVSCEPNLGDIVSRVKNSALHSEGKFTCQKCKLWKSEWLPRPKWLRPAEGQIGELYLLHDFPVPFDHIQELLDSDTHLKRKKDQMVLVLCS